MIDLKKDQAGNDESRTMSYDEIVKLIFESEARFNEVLRATKLQSNERQPKQVKQPMPKERLEMILDCAWRIISLLVGAAVFLTFMYLMTH
jgi:hypothetical protein